MNKRPNKKRRLAVLVIAILLAGGATTYFVTRPQYVYCGGDVADARYSEIAARLNYPPNEKLDEVFAQMKSENEGNGNVNCLYTMFVYSGETNELVQATRYYAQLTNKLEGGAELAEPFRDQGVTLEAIEARQSGYQREEKTVDSSGVYF